MEKQLLNFELDPVRQTTGLFLVLILYLKLKILNSFQMICAAKILQGKSLTCQYMES